MPTIADLPDLSVAVPAGVIPEKGWVNNGVLSNFHPGQALIQYRSISTRFVEVAYQAAKNPDAFVRDPKNGQPISYEAFIGREASLLPGKAKHFGRPIERGGLISPREDWEHVTVAAMASFLSQKFAKGTREAEWLIKQEPQQLCEWTNWGDGRWGLAARFGETHGRGKNALGLLAEAIREDLIAGRPLPHAKEAEWPALQAALIPRLAELSEQRARGVGPVSALASKHQYAAAAQAKLPLNATTTQDRPRGRVLNIRDLPGRQIPKGAVYIGRSMPALGLVDQGWGNPVNWKDVGYDQAVLQHEALFRRRLAHEPGLKKRLVAEIAGKDVVCWCAPKPCHGHTLLKLAQEAQSELAAEAREAGNPAPPGEKKAQFAAAWKALEADADQSSFMEAQETRPPTSGSKKLPLYLPGRDIISDNAELVVNTVNCVPGVMGKGVALAFKERWPAILVDHRQACETGALKPGGCLLFDLPDGRKWAALATKNHWRDPSRYDWVDSGLAELGRLARTAGIKSIALPPPGCGNGGLDWERVRPMVLKHLGDFDLRIYGTPPQGREMEALLETQRQPAPTATRANTSEPANSLSAKTTIAYAGVGSRETPTVALERMKEIGAAMARAGWTLRSGAADGADSAFEAGCDHAGGKKEIFLPFPGFRGHASKLSAIPPKAFEMARAFHPAWDRLEAQRRVPGKPSFGEQAMARNCQQLLGEKLDSPSRLVICWTKNGEVTGGTGQALRIAKAKGIPIINLGNSQHWELSTDQIVAAAKKLLDQAASTRGVINEPNTQPPREERQSHSEPGRSALVAKGRER